MQRVYADELKEVLDYLSKNNRRKYLEELQERAKSELLRAFETPSIHPLVVDVKTRGDNDPDHKIKSDRKIAIKLYKWRRSAELRGERLPTASDIHDIGGITVVCSYPSDTDELKRFLEDEFSCDLFKVTPFRFMDPKKMRGYRAYHGFLRGLGRYRGLKCEIQIKTFNTLTWGIKTHDLTYKPSGEIDARLTGYMEKLVSVAQILDEQSEILKSQISDAWELDFIRRDTARKHMLVGVNRSEDDEAAEIAAQVELHADKISVADVSTPLVSGLLDRIEDYIEDEGKGHNIEICRVCAVFALTRKSNDHNDWAIEIIDNWINGLDGEDLKNKALVFRSLVAMALGEYEEAISTGRLVVEVAEAKADPLAISSARANLAYFLAEAYYHRAFDEAAGGEEIITEGTDTCAEEALEIVSALEAATPTDEFRLQTLDTIGAVLIACSAEEADIRRGLNLCKEALSRAGGTDAEQSSKSFFALHEKRTFRRLLSF